MLVSEAIDQLVKQVGHQSKVGGPIPGCLLSTCRTILRETPNKKLLLRIHNRKSHNGRFCCSRYPVNSFTIVSFTVRVYEENASWAKLAARLSSRTLFRLSKLILLCVEPDVNVDIAVSRFSTMKERRMTF